MATAPTPRELDDYREQADRFIATIDEEYYLHYAGHKQSLDLAPIYERFAELTSLEQANRVGAAVDGNRRIRELWRFACQGYLGNLTREHDELVSSVHRDEMARTQQKMRIEQLEERALEELGLDPESLMSDYGPGQLVPFTGLVEDGDETPEPTPFVREEQAKRLRTAERELAMLGTVNPLALEEFSALEERHRAGHLDAQRYADERRELVITLERIYAELDEEAAA